MKRRLSAMAIFAALALGLGFSAPAGATAAIGAAGAAANAAPAAAEPLAEQVRNHRRGGWNRGHQRSGRHHYGPRRHYSPRRYGPSYRGPGIHFHFGSPSHRYVRPRYVQPRYTAPRRAVRLSGAHYNWCHSRYRSYRASDNTFNPGRGLPRRQCISPYS